MITLSSGTEAELRYEKGRQRENVTLGKVAKYCWASLTIFVYQGSSWWPRGATSRLLSGVLMLIAIVFGSVYSGSITAFLAIPFRSQPVNSLDDLVATDIKPAFREGASTYNFFVEFEQRVDFMSTGTDGRSPRESEGSYDVLHCSPSRLLGILQRHRSGQICSNRMRWLRGYGIIQYMKNQYYKKACDAVAYSDQPKPLSVTQAQGAFYVISVGLGAALAAFLLEFFVHRCSDSE
ncbi:glutamate receptor 1-like isoform X3 [Macrobrachium nipponense]|uniref:glutamate receptor 1-like isoform X3 n=1 Tax=Macrobrachium nipponense TaxID=159736 RepID=UPI0030C8CD83